MNIFSPIDLKLTKLQKKAKKFRLRRVQPQYNTFYFGKKYKSGRGGGQKN